jgi:hypothetical protein
VFGHDDREMKFHRSLFPFLIVACTLTACATSSDPGDSWSESYVGPFDRVFEAVLDVLEDEDYLVEADRAAGKVTAQPSRSKQNRTAPFVVRVFEKSGRIRVDVQVRSTFEDSLARSSRVETSVLEFFHELELRLHGLKD